MAVITRKPHDPSGSDVIDYYAFVDRPVTTTWIDITADAAGLHP